MKPADIIVLIILAVCVGFALFFTFRKRKNGCGCSGGCGDCSSCPMAQSCEKSK